MDLILNLIKNINYTHDKKFVLKAVKINGRALKYASEEIKNDKEVVLEAVKKMWNVFILCIKTT